MTMVIDHIPYTVEKTSDEKTCLQCSFGFLFSMN